MVWGICAEHWSWDMQSIHNDASFNLPTFDQASKSCTPWRAGCVHYEQCMRWRPRNCCAFFFQHYRGVVDKWNCNVYIIYMFIHIYTYVCVYIHMHTYVYVYMCVRMCVCVCIYIYYIYMYEYTWVWSLGWEDPLEEGMATHSRIPWTEEPGRLQSIESQRVEHD